MGRNGMGKTTLLARDHGSSADRRRAASAFSSHDITGRRPFAISNLGIAYVPQGREIFPDFTVEENLLLGVLGKPGLSARVPEPDPRVVPAARRAPPPEGRHALGRRAAAAGNRARADRPPAAAAARRAVRRHSALDRAGSRRDAAPDRRGGAPDRAVGRAEPRSGAAPRRPLPVHRERPARRPKRRPAQLRADPALLHRYLSA